MFFCVCVLRITDRSGTGGSGRVLWDAEVCIGVDVGSPVVVADGVGKEDDEPGED